MNKNFLFVVPRYANKNQYYIFPYGLAYVSANMKKYGFNVFTLNLCHHEESVEILLSEKIKDHNINVVCTGAMSFHWAEVEDIINSVKKINPDIITVVGGAIITADIQLALENMQIDYGVIGEGEETVVDLADALCKNRDITTVKGIGYLDADKKLCLTEPRPPIKDLDSLPFPDYEGLEFDKWLEIDWVEQPSIKGLLFDLNDRQRLAEINTSRSCPFNCTFCFHPLGNKYRQRSLDNVFEEIDYLKEKYDITLINVLDELFSRDEARILEFATRIKKYNIKWMAQWRVDTVNEHIIQIVKDSNVLTLGLGVESLSNTVLKSMKKRITKEEIENAYQICDKIGVRTGSNIIFGDIAETEETIRESLDWWKSHQQYDLLLGFIKAVPDSEIWRYAISQRLITDKKKFVREKFPIINLTKIDDKKFHKIKREVFEINFMSKYILEGKVLSSEKMPGCYKGNQIYHFRVKCPICSNISDYTYIKYSQLPFSHVLCKHCYKQLKISTRIAFMEPFLTHMRSVLYSHMVVLTCIRLWDISLFRSGIKRMRRLIGGIRQ